MPKHVTLTGMMGSGKSTVAVPLAQKLNRPIIEVDALIEAQEGKAISDIFLDSGEAYFRRVEIKIIEEILLNSVPAVISLGGGAFLWEATRELLLHRTTVFYLSTSVAALIFRLEYNRQKRPLLAKAGMDMNKFLTEMLAVRSVHYEKAHHKVTTESKTPEELALEILEHRVEFE